jgi:peptidyl-dipeptidase Dcp
LALSSKIYQNKKLFKRIETLYNSPDREVDQRATAVNLVELYQFCQGRSLNPEAKEKVAKINGELASYFLRSVRIYWPKKTMNTWL